MATFRTVTAPAVEPVTLTELKLALRVTSTTDDARLTAMIEGARKWAEEYTGLRFITQVVELSFCKWPSVEFPLCVFPIQTIDSVKYYDTGSPQTDTTLVDGTDYIANIYYRPSGILRALTGWPSASTDYNSIRVRMTVGYGLAVDVPAGIKEAIKMYCASGYLCAPEMVPAAKDALRIYRVNL